MLGRLVLRGALQVSAVDQELINNHTDLPDKFVVRAQQHPTQGAAAGSGSSGVGGSGGSGGSLTVGKLVPHFYLQVLAESFAKDLPSVRRGEQQLAALAGEFVPFRTDGSFNLCSRYGMAYGDDRSVASALNPMISCFGLFE